LDRKIRIFLAKAHHSHTMIAKAVCGGYGAVADRHHAYRREGPGDFEQPRVVCRLGRRRRRMPRGHRA